MTHQIQEFADTPPRAQVLGGEQPPNAYAELEGEEHQDDGQQEVGR